MAATSDSGARRLLVQAGVGAVLGWAVLSGLLLTNAAGLATLVLGSDLRLVALALLAFQFAAGFATFAVATAAAMPPASQPRGRSTVRHPRPAAAMARRRR